MKVDGARQPARDWLLRGGFDFQFYWPVAPFHDRLLECQPEPASQDLAIAIMDAGGVEVNQSAAASEIFVELTELIFRPVVVPVVGDHDAGVAPLIFAGPAKRRFYAHAWELGQHRLPLFLPGWIIVFAGTMI